MSAIREATTAELVEHGYRGVTFEGVARRAGTSKPVLYRRYPSRAHMIVDALIVLAPPPVETTATPSLRADLLAMLNVAVDRFHRIGIDTYRRLAADADDELFGVITAQFAELAERTIHRALSAARDRGEIGTAEIPERAATTIVALVRNEVFFSRAPVDEGTLIDMLDNVYLPLIDAVSHRSDGQRGATMPLS